MLEGEDGVANVGKREIGKKKGPVNNVTGIPI